MNKYLFLLFSIMILVTMSALADDAQNSLHTIDHQFFIENKGQWPAEVKYLSRIGGMDVWIMDSGVVYDYYQIIRDEANSDENFNPIMSSEKSEHRNYRVKGHVVRAVLENTNSIAGASGKGELAAYYNYFIGNDPGKWANFVSLYKEVQIQNIYEGIDIRYYFDNGLVRYDYQVAAGADISRIQLQLEGADGYSVNQAGELQIRTSLGEVTHGKLYAYQMIDGHEQEVSCRFEQQANGKLGIQAEGYDINKPVIIDPLVYSTFIGGSGLSGSDYATSIAIDNTGNTYTTGFTSSANYPTTSGAYDLSHNGDSDVFVTKLNADGSDLIYSTFIGGSDSDDSRAIVLDNNSNVYVAGHTYSFNYPTTSNVFDRSFLGESDVFVTKLNADGSGLVYSTFLGGAQSEAAFSIAIDNSGNAYVGGNTNSTNYPATGSAYDQSLDGESDVFLTKLNSNGSALIYSTFIGGVNDDFCNAIIVDNSDNVYLAGHTWSTNFPTTSNGYDRSHGGEIDAFVAKLNASGSALVYSTFMGGTNNDVCRSIGIDNSGCAYIAGETESTDYPTTSGAYDLSHAGNSDAFVSKLNADGSGLIYSTFIGETSFEFCFSIAIDLSGNAYLTGGTGSANYPTTSDAYDRSHNSSHYRDAFMTILNASGSGLVYSTFLGGEESEDGNSIAIDSNGNAYVAGITGSANFPTTSGAYDQSFNGGFYDAFIAKIQTPVTISIQDIWWVNKVDNDGDGYAQSALLCWLPSVSGLEQIAAYHKIYYRNENSSWPIWYDTNIMLNETLTPGGPVRSALIKSADVNLISGQATFDFKIRMGLNFMAGMTPFWTFLPEDFGALNDVKFETPADDGESVGSTFWADVDDDDDVDIIDIQLVAAHWNTKAGEQNYNSRYDVDNEGAGDEDIDIIDIQLVAAWWNKPIPPGFGD